MPGTHTHTHNTDTKHNQLHTHTDGVTCVHMHRQAAHFPPPERFTQTQMSSFLHANVWLFAQIHAETEKTFEVNKYTDTLSLCLLPLSKYTLT